MLNHAGIKSRMVLLSPRSMGITHYLPGPRFSHAISVIDTPNGPFWVDATAEGMTFGDLPSEDQGVPALIIGAGVNDLTTTPVLPAEKSTLTETVTAALDAQGNLTATTELQFTGSLGWLLRLAFRQIPESAQEQALTGFFGRVLPDAKISRSTITGLESSDKPLLQSCAYATANFAQVAGNLLIAKAPWAEDLSGGNMQALNLTSARRTDLEISGAGGRHISSVKLTLPPGFQAKDLKPEIKEDSSFGSYRFTQSQTGDAVTWYRETILSALRIPAAAPDFLRYSEAASKQSKTPLILQKP